MALQYTVKTLTLIHFLNKAGECGKVAFYIFDNEQINNNSNKCKAYKMNFSENNCILQPNEVEMH